MKKLTNSEAKLKKSVAYKKIACIKDKFYVKGKRSASKMQFCEGLNPGRMKYT